MTMRSALRLSLPAIAAALLLLQPSAAFAAPSGCSTNNDNLISVDSIGLPTYGCGDSGTYQSTVATILRLVFGVLALLSLLFIVIGGLRYTLSGGDSNAVESAKKTILYAVIGLVLGVSVFTLIGFVFSLL